MPIFVRFLWKAFSFYLTYLEFFYFQSWSIPDFQRPINHEISFNFSVGTLSAEIIWVLWKNNFFSIGKLFVAKNSGSRFQKSSILGKRRHYRVYLVSGRKKKKRKKKSWSLKYVFLQKKSSKNFETIQWGKGHDYSEHRSF